MTKIRKTKTFDTTGKRQPCPFGRKCDWGEIMIGSELCRHCEFCESYTDEQIKCLNEPKPPKNGK